MSLDDRAAKAERQPHAEYRYLIDDGGEESWAHCPVCRSVNAGWWEDGSPKYSGGIVTADVGDDNVAGVMTSFAYACLCEAGRLRTVKQDVSPITNAPRMAVFHSRAAHVLWLRGTSAGPPPTPKPPAESGELSAHLRAQIARYTDKELTIHELCTIVTRLAERANTEIGRLNPPIWGVIQNRSLRSLYFAPKRAAAVSTDPFS